MAASRSTARIVGGARTALKSAERARIALTLYCCDREAISWVATTGGINSSDIRDLMIESVERRFGFVDKLPKPIEWLSDNDSPYTAGETRALARHIGLVPCTRPDPKSPVERHGRSLRQNLQAGLRSGQPETRCGQRAAPARFLVRASQPHASAQGTGLPLAARVQKWCRPHGGTAAAAAIGSSPSAAHSAVARNASLDASASVDHP